jgi:hypothetical protein
MNDRFAMVEVIEVIQVMEVSPWPGLDQSSST